MNGFPHTTQSILAGPTRRRSNIHSILHDLHSKKVALPPEGTDGTCESGP